MVFLVKAEPRGSVDFSQISLLGDHLPTSNHLPQYCLFLKCVTIF